MLTDIILENTSKLKSSVKGGKWKKTLSPGYKKIKSKVAPGVPNMELTGDMLDALMFKPYRDGIEIGVFDTEEAKKADNHNKFTAKSRKTKVPERQFIPRKGQQFKPDILKELKTLAMEVAEDDQD